MSQDTQVVNQDSDQAPAVDPQTQVTPNPTDVRKPAPGDKTDSALLLESLREEREKRRQLEEENQKLKSVALSDNQSDEGKAIIEQFVKPLQDTVNSLQDSLALKDLQVAYPQLKELTTEFNEYRQEFPRHKLENVAKLFLTEKGFLEAPRKGLETTTGGSRVPQKQGMSSEDISDLRKNNFKLYREKLLNGELN